MDMAIVEFPANAKLEYLAEGAANIVYSFSLPPPSPSIEADASLDDYKDGRSTPPPSELPALHYDPIFHNTLLRLRKHLSTTTSVLESQEKFEQVIQSLIHSKYLVQQTLVKLPPDLQANCNRSLQYMEEAGTRSRKRRGAYLTADAIYGTLVTDMTSAGNQGQVVIDFKPKWLAQSPSAPPGAKRCRTCALRAMRKAFGKLKDEPYYEPRVQRPPSYLCPLDLVTDDPGRVSLAVKGIMDHSEWPPSAREWLAPQLTDYFTANPIIRLLRSLQQSLDPRGVLQANINDPDFLTAMTLRDCTMFVVVPSPGHGNVHARLGDLDWKSPNGGKAEHWLDTERRLVNEGWYTATEENRTPRSGGEEQWCNV